MRRLIGFIITVSFLFIGCNNTGNNPHVTTSDATTKHKAPEDTAVLKLAPAEYRAKVEHAFSQAGTNKTELVNALMSAPEEYRPGIAFLISQTGYRYFLPSMDKKILDAATISAEFLTAHIKLGYEARRIWPWVKDIDDDTFQRFVLSYRTTTEKLIDWRTYFWNHSELRPLMDEYAKRFSQAQTKEDKNQIFREMIHKINTEWVGKNVPYAPRGMPDMNPLEAINAKTGRCTDQTNTLIAILRTFGIAATGVRAVWWPEHNDNHTWTAVYNPVAKEWLDVDSGQGGTASDPDYFRKFIHHKEKKSAKIYWVAPGEETGPIFTGLQLKGNEGYPPSIEKYLIAKPMKDMTERYNNVIDLNCSDLPADTLIWLAIQNSGMWKPVAGARSTPDGQVTFSKVGCEVRYRLMTWNNDTPAYCSPVISVLPDGSIKIIPPDPKDNFLLLEHQAIKSLESGDFKEAKSVLLKILEYTPTNSNTLYNLACVLSLMGETKDALDYLEKSVSVGWEDFEHIKKDTDLDNIRAEVRYQQIMKFMDKESYPQLTYPTERAKLSYAIIVGRATNADTDWAKVVDAFTKKYKARVFIYDGIDPAAVMKELVNYAPKYVAFIAMPSEITFPFITRAKQMMCTIDEDPYEDTLWGIITGYDYQDCLRMARADKLVIKNGLSGVGGGWLDYFNEGLSFSEGEKNAMFVKKPGKPLEKQQGPDDTTKSFVDALNTNKYQIMSTSGHATERDWQIGYSYPNGCLFPKAGRLFGRDLANNEYPINTDNSKIYFSPGNCLIAHISADLDCMALSWLHNGANQFYGHTLWQFSDGSCRSFNITEYFMALQERFTFSESIYLNRAAIVFKGESNRCCRSTVLYGDPAWESRLNPEIEPPYTQSLKFDKKDKQVTITFTIDFNKDYEGRPAGAFLPELIQNPQVKSVPKELKVLALDNLIMVDLGKRTKGSHCEITISADLAGIK